MRLIDADELKKVLNETFDSVEVYLSNEIIATIDNAPTVESKTIADCIIAYGDGYEAARRMQDMSGELPYEQ